jgi:hypothetical protein
MQDKNFEHQVKDLLYNHEEAAPNVMNNVFEKRTPLYVFRNKLILNKYKLIAAAALIGVLAFLANYNLNRSEIVEPSIETVTEQPVIAQSDNQVSATLPAESTAIDIQHTDVVNDVTANKPANVTVNEQKSAKTTNEGSFDNVRTTKQEEINQMPVDSKGRNNVDQHKGAEEGKSDADWNTNKAQNVADASTKDQGELKDNTLAQQANDEGVAENDNNNADRNQENISTENETDNTVETKQDIAAVDESKPSTDATNATDAIGDEDFGLTKTTARNWSVSLNTIIGSGSRNLDQSGDIATVVVRDNTESNQLSYGTELLLNYRLLDNLEAFGGVGFFNRRESMNYYQQSFVTDMNVTSKQVIEQHPVFGTRKVTVYDTTYNQRSVEATSAYNNSYKHFYVPVGLRYTLYGKKLGIHLAVNGGLEVMTKTSGVVLNDKYKEVVIDEGFARTRMGNMVGVGFGVTMLAKERLNILAEVKGNFFLSPTNGASYPVNQNDLGYGLSLGLKYDLK